MKKRKQIIRSVGAVLCALVVVFTSFGSEFYLANDVSTVYNYNIGAINTYAKTCTCSDTSAVESLLSLEWDKETYPYYVISHDVNACRNGNTCWYIYIYKQPPTVRLKTFSISGWGKYLLYVYDSSGLKAWCKPNGEALSSFSSVGSVEGAFIMASNIDGTSMDGDYSCSQPNSYHEVVASNCDIYVGSSDTLFFKGGEDNYNPQKYNVDLGYLQDIKSQFLYLENDAWDLVEDTAVNKYTFSSITTTGLDITQGDWDVRLYGQLVIRDLDNEAEITVYDKVYLGEYSASDLKIMIPYKETNEQINNASGFDGLSWWESEFLHYYTFYNTYLQLVRTNSDGTVEYGGFLKIWKASNNVTYTDTLDENGNVYDEGYVNKPIENGSHGSGSTYEEAEKDAVKNEEEREQHNADMGDLENALSGFTSTLGVIPNVIASVFSFLPPWCLNICAVGFGLLIVLIIWKTARG